MLFAVTQVSANPPGVPVPEPGPLSCTTQPGGDFLITAITGQSSPPLPGTFPIPATRESITPCQTVDTCFDYGYNITSPTGLNVSTTVFAISADQNLDSTNPTASVSPPGVGDTTTKFLAGAVHEYTVGFSSSSTKSATAHILITPPSAARITTVLVKSGSKTESCLIAGPGVPGNPFAPVPAKQDIVCAGGKCTCHLTFDSLGNLQTVTTDTPCTAASVSVCVSTDGGQTCQPAQSYEQITSGTGTCTTYPTKPVATTVCF
jgi:hypothetical protein